MGMVVQHNMQAANANRLLGITTGQQQKSTEKLSSGYKINKAADDAAGLAISEKMRKQVRGLDRASTNAQDGISAVQTAEGALNEVHSMLQRMNELAVQSANGTNSVTDRASIQSEIDQLTTEIDRVAETTKFNETYLLKGDRTAPQKYSFHYGKAAASLSASITGTDGATLTTDKLTQKETQITAQFSWATPDGSDGVATAEDQNAIAKSIRDTGVILGKSNVWKIDPSTGDGDKEDRYTFELTGDAAQKYDVVADNDDPQHKFIIQTKSGDKIADVTLDGGEVADATATMAGGSISGTASAVSAKAAMSKKEQMSYYDADGNKIADNALDKYFSVDSSGKAQPKPGAPKVYDALGNQTSLLSKEKHGFVDAVKDMIGDLSLKLHVGADSTSNNQIQIDISAMSSKGLGVGGLKVDGSDDTNARDSITKISAALQKVSDQRSNLGAAQNRLEHTIDNLDNAVENTQTAESRIRDTDMADEMVTYSKNNILAQAGQSMLAQANQSNQGVLSILG